MGKLAHGVKVRVVIEGTVSGYSMYDYGCSLELKVSSLEVNKPGGDADDGKGGRSLLALTQRLGKKGDK